MACGNYGKATMILMPKCKRRSDLQYVIFVRLSKLIPFCLAKCSTRIPPFYQMSSAIIVFLISLIYLDFFTPYFERPHDLFFTPAASKVPRTI